MLSLQKHLKFTILITVLLFSSGCIKKIVMNKVVDALTSDGSTVFTGDNDPQLIADALPLTLKMYESILQSIPKDDRMLRSTGAAFCMYSYAFVQTPSDTISNDGIEKKREHQLRAKKLYLRAFGYMKRAMEVRHPGFMKYFNENKIDSALTLTSLADTTYLYWFGASLMGAFTTDKFDMELAIDMPKAIACMHKLLALKEDYGNGSVHDFFVSFYGSMPKSMGGSEEKARKHFARSQELSNNLSIGSYVSLATSVCVKNQNVEEFKELLNKALSIDIDKNIANRLANTLSQTKAKFLLTHIDNYFLIEDDDDTEFEEEL